jgi:hypothetical protein
MVGHVQSPAANPQSVARIPVYYTEAQ